MMRKFNPLFVRLVAIGLVGCVGSDDFGLLGDDPADDDWASRRARLNVTVIADDGSGPSSRELSIATLENEVVHECMDLAATGPAAHRACQGLAPLGMDCNALTCQANLALCVAHRMRELAELVTEAPLRLPINGASITAIPQDMASRAALDEEALRLSQLAITIAGENLRGGSGVEAEPALARCVNTVLGKNPDGLMSFGESLAFDLAEGAHLVQESAAAAFEANIAVAQSDFSRRPGTASRAAWAAPSLSRLHAAQLLVGAPSVTTSVGARPPITSPAFASWSLLASGNVPSAAPGTSDDAANDLLLEAGLRPADVFDVENTTFDELYRGTGGVSVGLRTALGDITGLPELNGPSPLSSAAFLQTLNLTEANFLAARTRQRELYAAFGRDLLAEMPTLALATDPRPSLPARPYGHARYIATSLPPTVAPNAFYVRLARLGVDGLDDRAVAGADRARPSSAYARRGVAGSIDYAVTAAYSVLSNMALSPAATEALGGVISANYEARTARLEVSYRRAVATGHEIRLRVYGDNISSSSLLVVRGTGGLSCAVRGNIDAAPCTLSDFTVGSTGAAETITNRSFGFPSAIRYSFTQLDPATPLDYHIVRLRAGASSNGAGSYEEVGPVYFNHFNPAAPTSAQWVTINVYSVLTSIPPRVSAALASDTGAPAEPAAACGVLEDTRIPLENELIDDGNAFESSWRHHIDVAASAAEHADMLGEQVIESGTEIDRRADQANEALLRACGVTVNLDGLFGAAAGPLVTSGACSAGEGVTIAGRCVHLAVENITAAGATDRDARVLAECLGDDTTIPLASLGSASLCVWRRRADTGFICEGATTTNRCPFPADPDTGLCETRVPAGLAPADYETVPVPVRLGFFGPPAAGDDPTAASTSVSTAPSCYDVRLLRDSFASDAVRAAALQRIRDTNFYHTGSVRQWASRIGWSGRAGDHSAVTIDDVSWLQTGDIFTDTGPITTFPCRGPLPGGALPACSADSSPLFCSSIVCGDRSARVTYNHRTARAALALAILSGVGPLHMELPIAYANSVEAPFLRLAVNSANPIYDLAGNPWEFASDGTLRFGGDPTLYGRIYRSSQLIWTGQPVGRLFAGEWVAFANLGTSPPSDDAERQPAIVSAIWSGMSVLTPVRSSAFGYDAIVRRSIDLRASPDRIVVDGSGWRREAGCSDIVGVCNPNIENLTTYWSDPNTLANDRTRLVYNLARVDARGDASSGLVVRDVLDGLELMCEAAHAVESEVAGGCDLTRPPEVTTRAHLPRLRQYLLCAANSVEEQGDRAVVQNLPSRLVASWTADSSPGRVPSDTGDLGSATVDVQQALLQLSGVHRQIAIQIRNVEYTLSQLEEQLANIDARREITDLHTLSGALSQVTACASSQTANGAVANCANAVAQIAIGFRLRDLELATLSHDENLLVSQSLSQLQERGDTLSGIAEQVNLLVNQLNGGLSRYELARSAANRALADALFLSSDPAGRSIPFNTALMNRYDLRAVRYAEARRDAVRLAEIARRALEQRLGTRLTDLHGLSLVDDPEGWVNDLCSSSGIDYARLRDATSLPYRTEDFMFVGDYVRRLNLVFESYRLDYPFESSTDTAVVSMRDELFNVRSTCDAPVYNLLASSGDPRRPGWVVSEEGCSPVPDGTGGDRIFGCVVATTIDPGTRADGLPIDPGFVDSPAFGSAPAMRVVFASGATGAATDPPLSFTPSTRISQRVVLSTPGTYLLSWFGRNTAGSNAAELAVEMTAADGSALEASAPLVAPVVAGDDPARWNRYFRFYSVTATGPVNVAIRPQGPFVPLVEQFVDLAALQLEDVTAVVTGAPAGITQAMVTADRTGRLLPRSFVSTTAPGVAPRATCEDTTGRIFREGWRLGCVHICPQGFDRGCTEADTVEQCFHEREFTVSEDALERGEILGRTGFASGNFNYRTEGVALNFVGTGARSCADERLPSTCYSAGFIPYTIEHLGSGGGYEVRNHSGQIYHAPLFEGRIEHARGLAAERYVTNPLSAADRSLVEPYVRHELIGRPIAGRYVVRIWEAPGVNFEGIEDIQLVLNYRYWTRID